MILKKNYEVTKLSCVYNTLEKYVAYVFPDSIISSWKEKTMILNRVCHLHLRMWICDTILRICTFPLY